MGFFQKFKEVMTMDINPYNKGLEKTRHEVDTKLNMLSKKHHQIDDAYYDELEEILIMADVGVETVEELIKRLKKRVKDENIIDVNDLKEVIVDEMLIIYVGNDIISSKININQDGLTVVLMVGVNGVGKTTTIGKLANYYTKQGKKVLLIAADTFRAGAKEQLEVWSKRTKADIYLKDGDPSSVIYDGLKKALDEQYDMVFIDTAGRLQTKDNLMQELAKMNKVIGNLVPNAPQETLLVIDATTGQNGISQAKNFKDITNITGIVLTKLDGTAKGGIVLAIKKAVNIPVKFIGVGEGIDDMEPFDIEKYIYGLFKDLGE
jgi:fused signal recognition particle receptor